MQFDFHDRVIVIAGASGGMGRATAELLARLGAHTVCLSRSGAPEVVRALHSGGHSVLGLSCDLARDEDVRAAVDAIAARFGRIHGLVYAAAINRRVRFGEVDAAEWRRVIDVNLTGAFLLCQAALPLMKASAGGSVVLVSSVAARWRSALSGIHYVTSKAALLGFTRQLAFELADTGIRVNAVCPGQTETPMLAQSLAGVDPAAVLRNIPLGRFATADEQAQVMAFLLSAASSYVNGAIIDVNGGQL